MEEYSLYSEFDASLHRERYPHYLEVLIDRDGKVLYAVPSHQEKAIELACREKGWTRERLKKECPPEYYFDFLDWLLALSGSVSVWTYAYKGEPNKNQKKTLVNLKNAGVYEGEIDWRE
jgi:hypothetical protein